ncbi:MSL2 ligase, partial [Polyodon spathula]|nr:MSL2 ligase [Polyodon spathula]
MICIVLSFSGNLLQDPIAPTNSTCQHYVCKACKGKKMMMKPSCSWCKDYEQFEDNKQLCILVDCYRKLCEYIAESPLAQQIASAVGGSPDILAMLKEGLLLNEDEQEDSQVAVSQSLSRSPTKVVYKKPQEKKGCKCGRATQNPSVLTCRGQRCPCYSNRKACLDCICRGCQNSYMANGEKKLEAFAVPEKALEQTRLTLGINVTSIAVRNASTSANVINVTAGSPVATFLAASPHEDKNFDETLDMRFDC